MLWTIMMATACTVTASTVGSPVKEDVNARFAYLVDRAQQEHEAFVAIIVDGATGQILAEGINDSPNDPTQHCEIAAIRNLASKLPRRQWHSLIMYTTAEPCPMCSGALVYSDIKTVYYGIDRATLFGRGWHEFRLRTAAIFDDANRSSGFAAHLEHYEGKHLKACEDLFKPR